MKKLILLLWLLPILGNCPAKEKFKVITKQHIETANFTITYQKIRLYEGYFVNDIADPGGITYAGITYKWNKDWYGWRYVNLKSIKRNERVEACEHWVLDHYLNIWVSEGFYKLKNQEVANYLLDMRVNNSRRTTIKLCNKIKGFSVKHQEEWITSELDSINLKQLSKLRSNHYHKLVKESPEKRKFLKHWLKRSNNIL